MCIRDSPPMTYIKGEEMTSYTMDLIVDQWIKPHFDISQWENYDLSCKSRDDTEDQVLQDAVDSGSRLCAIFKEPTITPTEVQKKKLGLKKAWGSPNGAMRRGWNGITISRDTIHIEGMRLGFERPVLFERHAVGGEYAAGWDTVGAGQLVTTFFPEDGSSPSIVDGRRLTDEESVVVVYDNPLDNVDDLAHIFFQRCLAAEVVPYVVTKKTVFKWQEGFWLKMKGVFDQDYHDKFEKAGLLDTCGGTLQHLISDAATMQIIRWTGGGFGMACHNYDGDMLTDEVAQMHRSPGFMSSNLVGRRDDGVMIKEFEASHGTVADLWHDHLDGKETSMNPLGMVEALIGAMQHAASLDTTHQEEVVQFTNELRQHLHAAMVAGKGTRDLCGPEGLTTEQFISEITRRIDEHEDAKMPPQKVTADKKLRANFKIDQEAVQELFAKYDGNANGAIDLEEFTNLLVDLEIAPKEKLAEKAEEDAGKEEKQ
eukprot:TRINITY_DN728_c0_g1_i1.p1 TRINITY_DN728_c0_g1~~TRINITY_DN728_c0_g1_i1.p1  ORF type:complete len:483 (+),score=173.41 TRINITY_DN728_c0_g1_i1:141-1589(+)